MKKTKHILYTLFAALGVFVLASCMSDNIDDCDCFDDNGKLSFQIAVPKSKVVTRAIENGVGNENFISSLRLYFFNGETMAYNTQVTGRITENTDILLPVEAVNEGLFVGNVSYTVYAVVNLDDDLTGRTLTQFKEHIVNKAIGTTTSGDFVMWAKVTPSANLKLKSADNRIGNFELKRAAVKIRMKLSAFNLNGYAAGQPTIVLNNITDRSFLEKDEVPAGVVFSNSAETALNFGDTSDPFYSYPNFWEDNADNATHILLKVPLTKSGQTTAKDYFYKVSLNGDNTSILANHLYEVTVTVNKPGSLDPENPAPIDAFFSVKDWGEEAVNSEIKAAHYLLVAETYVEMKNITEYFIDYTTSDPAEIVDVKAQFIYVSNQTGNPVIEDATDDQAPDVTLEAGNKIKINSEVPVNYIPKKITFKIRHTTATGIDPVEVTLWQYPPTFITNTTGTKSSWRNDLPSHLNNKSIYRITNLVPSQLPGNAVLGFPPTTEARFYTRSWGTYYLQHTDQITANNEETANMISPNFELASQLGATDLMGYRVLRDNGYWRYYTTYQDERYAVHTCALYWEERLENGVTKRYSDWRLPTRAEIQLIDQMQQQGTAVTEIMTGRYYWSGLSNSAIRITLPTASGSATANNAHVRCVRDVKEAPLGN